MRTLAIIQARMSSSRLPGKVLVDIHGQPMLQHMLERVQKTKTLDGVVVATTTDPSDDSLAKFCDQARIPCYRGSLHDVLDRYYQAALQFQAGIVVRLTGDCPLIDPEVLDLTVSTFLGEPLPGPAALAPDFSDFSSPETSPFDFSADRLPPPWKRTLPIGLDVEVCSFAALQRAWREARQPHQREHVMPFLYEGVSFKETIPPEASGWYIEQGITPRGFKVALLNHAPDYGSLRWTVDTPSDLEFVRQVFVRLDGNLDFGWQDVLTLLENEPELASINAEVKHKSAYDVDSRRVSN